MKGRLLNGLVLAIVLVFAGQSRAEDPAPVPAVKTYQQPVLLTSCGQAADVLMLKGMCARAGLDFKYRPFASADSLKDIKSIILVAGGSSKGLGAAKADADAEEKRIKALLEAAKKAKMPVVVFHVGGEARRGALSDPFNKLAAEGGEVIVVAKGGDDDGLFKKIAASNKARYIAIENTAGSLIVLNELFPKVKK